MTVKFQLSDKRGDAILVVSAEGPGNDIAAIYGGFAGAVQDAGLDSALQAFSDLPGAVGAVKQAFPTAQIMPQSPPDPWGQPPVPAFQPAAQPPYQPQMPAAAAPQAAGKQCHHGPMTYREGTGKTGKPYKAYFCPARSNDPTQCDPQFIR